MNGNLSEKVENARTVNNYVWSCQDDLLTERTI